LVFKDSSGHGRPPSSLEHNQSPFLAGPKTPAQTYQTSHPQSEWDNLFLSLNDSKINMSTVEPRLSGPRFSGFLDYPDLLFWFHFFL